MFGIALGGVGVLLASAFFDSTASQFIGAIAALAFVALLAIAKRWVTKKIVVPIQQVPQAVADVAVLKDDVAALKHTLTVNGNTNDPPTVLDRLQNVELVTVDLRRGQKAIRSHLTEQDADAEDAARQVAALAVITAADVKQDAADVAKTLKESNE
jgi:hypothetical protein